jgi:hypothetical protein
MAYRIAALANSNATDASFRLWINEIHNSLIAFGWTQTSDTGQINFSTVTRATAINIDQGYAIYQMGDSLQSSCPVFMKLIFGTGGTADRPGLKLQVCIGGTDGAGVLTGLVTGMGITTGLMQPGGVGPNLTGGGTGNCRSAGTSSSWRCNFWTLLASSGGFTICIERDHDLNGNETADGVNVIWHGIIQGLGSNLSSQFLATNGICTGIADVTRWYAEVSANVSQMSGGFVGVGPVRTIAGVLRNPVKGLLVTARGDFQSESLTQVLIYGSLHNYIMLRPHGAGANPLSQWNADCGVALLWE